MAIIAGRATSYADRRRAAAERLSRSEQIAQRLDAAVEGSAGTVDGTVDTASPVDPDGTLRSSIRALVPLAYRIEGFDVTVSLGPAHAWAARIRHDPDGVSAELVPGPGAPSGAAVHSSKRLAGSETEIVTELATLLRAGRGDGQ